MIETELYPLKFKPILKQKIWGGDKLVSKLNKESNLNDIGESWEISDVDNNVSIVKNGFLHKQSLKSLLKTYKADLIGHKNFKIFKDKFPLLIKFIDAKTDLSVQLHPNDALAAERHNSFGKTEMWYVMQADDNAKLIIDFNQNISKDKYLQHLNNKTLTDILNFETVSTGDSFFIEVGRVHAIGAGVMLAEIQQTSDITYRIYDWDRVDANGNTRDLHTDLAIDAIDFNMKEDYKLSYSKIENTSNKMASCSYFTTNFLPVNGKINKKNTFDSFIIYMCVDGEAQIQANNKTETLKTGETLLLPAIFKNFTIDANNAKLLEVYI